MRALKTFGIVASACFGFTMAMCCAGIIIQDQQRKHKEIDEMIKNIGVQHDRRVRGVG